MENLLKSNNDILQALEAEICKIKSFMYITPTIDEYESRIKNYTISGYSLPDAHLLILNDITSIMKDSQERVNRIIQDRINRGKIKSADQARRNAAGNNFQLIVAYSIIMNIIYKNIPNLMVVHQPKRGREYCKIVEENLQIEVLGEVQKPDCDLLIYNPEEDNDPIVIISCKTSIRERAGQTYRWKLLYDLSNCNCKHIEQTTICPIRKYNLQNHNQKKVKIGLITADFYDEISRPQVKGMAPFFNFCYITKEIEESENIEKLSSIVEYLNNIYK